MATILSEIRSLVRVIIRSSLGPALLPILLLLAAGTLAYSLLEGWTWLEALYATVITVTTVGYGDFTPQTAGGRVFAIIFTLTAIGLAGYVISTLAAIVIEYESTRVQRRIEERRMRRIADLDQHTIICGANVLAHRAANEFLQRRHPFIVLERDEETLKWALLWMNEAYVDKRRRALQALDEVDLEAEEKKSVDELADEIGIPYILGDPTEEQFLKRAGLNKALGLVAAMDDDRDNLAVVLSARDLANRLGNENLRIVARVHNEWNLRRIYLAGANKVVSANFVGGFQMATHVLNPVVGEFWDRMLFPGADRLVRLVDVAPTDRTGWVGATVGQLRHQGHLIIALKRNGDFVYAPGPEEIVQAADILITMGEGQPT